MHKHSTDIHISPQVFEQAADWLVRMHANESLTQQDYAKFEQWRNASPEHKAAWSKAEFLADKFGSVPPKLAMQTLIRPVDAERRGTLNKLLMLLIAIPGSWGAWKLLTPQAQSFQYQTATGERNTITLPDGSIVILNTQTTIDVYFETKQRAVFLRQGEIYIETAKDTDGKQRPFRVISQQGVLQALGTLFNVRESSGKTELTVYEGAVQLTPKHRQHDSFILEEGHQTRFNETSIDKVTAIKNAQATWLSGMLQAENMRLTDFVSELARYYNGGLRCDPSVADIQIAGAFPVTDTQKSLNMLISTYPVTVVSRMGQYWVTASQ